MSHEKFKGEGRILTVVNSRSPYALVAAPGIHGKILITPASLMVDAEIPLSFEDLQTDDILKFEAQRLESGGEFHGAKFVAVHETVKLTKRAVDATVDGEGKILSLDCSKGCFGFIETAEIGNVYFNVLAVRPKSVDVNKIFKIGQRVRFRASVNSSAGSAGSAPTSKWRALIICPYNKASEFFPTQTKSDEKSTVFRTKSNSCSFDVFSATTAVSDLQKNSSLPDKTNFEVDFVSKTMSVGENLRSGRNSPKNQSIDSNPDFFSISDHCRLITDNRYIDYNELSNRIVRLAHDLNEFSNIDQCNLCQWKIFYNFV